MKILELRDGVRKFREKKHLNQTLLAKKLAVTPANLSKWESGKGIPSFKQAKKLLEMGMPVEWLFEIEYNKIHDLIKVEEAKNDIEDRLLAVEKKLETLENEKNCDKCEKNIYLNM